jgi:hypothetical protein
MEFTEVVKRLAEARQALEKLNSAYKDKEAKFLAENAALIDQRLEMRHTVEVMEAELRRTTLEHFAATGERKPHPALGIRAGKVYNYAESDAKAWAIEHDMGGVLKLDKRPFEKLLEAGAVSGIDYQELSELTATIATDLSAYLRDPSVPF